MLFHVKIKHNLSQELCVFLFLGSTFVYFPVRTCVVPTELSENSRII